MGLNENVEKTENNIKAKPINERKIFTGSNKINQTFESPELNIKIKKYLPNNYSFEIPKIITRIKTLNAKRVCLQFPEGLFIFSTIISDLISEYVDCEIIILGDVTYGACCIDDYVASLNGCELIVHFAHSCLIPITEMVDNIKVLYIFVDIKFDVWHCVETFKKNVPLIENKTYVLAASIQFNSTLRPICTMLKEQGYKIEIPQSKPLSPGEILGCTSPKLDSSKIELVYFICDGRFHLEAMMIANPTIKNFYKYNPYDKQLTKEEYDFELMLKNREKAIRTSINLLETKKEITVGLILGTLGHQGSSKVLNNFQKKLQEKNINFMNVLIPEINAKLLNSFGDTIDFWLQISCPRLSIDWSLDIIKKPLLTPFEFNVVLEKNFNQFYDYPMDFYSSKSLGNWTPNHQCNSTCTCK